MRRAVELPTRVRISKEAESNAKRCGKACPSAIACAQYRKIRHVRPRRQFDNQTREGKGAERRICKVSSRAFSEDQYSITFEQRMSAVGKADIPKRDL
jgi:hypothetical protein